MGVIAASSIILLVGFVLQSVYRTPPQPSTTPQRAAALPDLTAPAIDGAQARAAWQVVDQFVEAMERENEAGMRARFPSLTNREARILLAIRQRLGEGADLRVDAGRMASRAAGEVHADFAIIATERGSKRERRLPFSATLIGERDSWAIAKLR